jgi:hypothetical protein
MKSESEYILASRIMLTWHFDYLNKYLKEKYNMIDSNYAGNSSKSIESFGSFLFEGESDELKEELFQFGMTVSLENKKVVLDKDFVYVPPKRKDGYADC